MQHISKTFFNPSMYSVQSYSQHYSSLTHRRLCLPVPLWCRVESTGQVSMSEAAGAAPSLDAHSQRPGCIHPQFFWTDCGPNVAQVTERSHGISKDLCYMSWCSNTQLWKETSHICCELCKSVCDLCCSGCHPSLTSLSSLCPIQQQFWREVALQDRRTWMPCWKLD